jgi:ribosome maturation factor RimP
MGSNRGASEARGAAGDARGARREPGRSAGTAGGARQARRRAPATAPHARVGADPRAAVETTVDGLGYDLVGIERAGRGLLRVTIDRRTGGRYAQPGDAVTVEDCEQVTRQLQYALEVEGVDYARLEVSSPGLDRPLRGPAEFERFAGLAVSLTLKLPFEGRRHFQGVLSRAAAGAGWQLALEDGGQGGRQGSAAGRVLGFTLDEVREARLVPVLDFKGRRGRDGTARPADAGVDGE